MSTATRPKQQEFDEIERVVRGRPEPLPTISAGDQQGVSDDPLQRAISRVLSAPRSSATPPPRSWWF